MKTHCGRDINCGRQWTLLAVECYLCCSCNQKCRYFEYCKRANNYIQPFILKHVISMLKQKLGEPSQELLDAALSDDLYL